MRMSRIASPLRAILLIAFMSTATIRSFAADLLDNTAQGTATIVSSTVLGSNIRSGVVFTTGSTAYDLTTLKLGLLNTAAQTIAFDIALYAADANGDPTGPVLGTKNVNQAFPASTSFYDFSMTGLTISATQKYILLLENAVFSSGTFGWAINFNNTAPVASGGLTYNGYRRFDGSSWSTNSNFGTIWLQGTAVPEPSTYAFAGISILALALSGRKFRNRA